MFEWDEKNQSLVAREVEPIDPGTVYQDSDMYKSYLKYCDETVKSDIENIFIPEFNKTLYSQDANFETPKNIWLKKDKNGNTVHVDAGLDTFFRGSTNAKNCTAIFQYAEFLGNQPRPLKLFTIPEMEKDGLLVRDGNRLYAVIAELAQGNHITWQKGELKILTDMGNVINLKDGTTNPKTRIGSSRSGPLLEDSILVAMELCLRDGIKNPAAEILKFRNPSVTKLMSDSVENGFDMLHNQLEFKISAKLENMMIEAYKNAKQLYDPKELEEVKLSGKPLNPLLYWAADPKYRVTDVRDELNEVLSLRRAVGYILAEDVRDNNGNILIAAGKRITNSDVTLLNRNRINTVYIQDIPNVTEYLTATPTVLRFLKRGSLIIDSIRMFLPEEERQNRYLSRNLTFDPTNALADMDNSDGHIIKSEFPVIPPYTAIDRDMLTMLAFNGIPIIKAVTSTTSSSISYISTVREIIGNNHYQLRDLGLKVEGLSDSDYVYVSADGTIMRNADIFTAHDMLAALSLFYALRSGKDLDYVASRDADFRKKVNQANELFHKAFEYAVKSTCSAKRNKWKSDLVSAGRGNITLLGDPDWVNEQIYIPLQKNWWKALMDHKWIAPMSTNFVNPTSYYSALTKVNTIVKNKHSISKEVVELSMGGYGKLCPYETPSGAKLGAVNNRAIRSRVEGGIMTTPYYKVLYDSASGRITLSEEKYYLTVNDEENARIADIMDFKVRKGTREVILNRDFNGNYIYKRVLARVPADSGDRITIAHIDMRYIDYVNIDPNQTDGWTATTIPFQGADDAARVIYGLSMCKQAKGLVEPDVPIVWTSGHYEIPRLSTKYMIIAEYDGIVKHRSDSKITMQYGRIVNGKFEPAKATDSIPSEVTYNFSLTEVHSATVIVRNIEVSEGQLVKAGHVLVSSNFIKDGLLAMGKNVLVCFANTGYNYEDGVYASERLRHKLTSYGVSKLEHRFAQHNNGTVGVLNHRYYMSQGKWVANVKEYGRDRKKTTRTVKATDKFVGFVNSSEPTYDSLKKRPTGFEFTSISIDYLHKGDKQSNRHGNKGVTTFFVKNDDMPMFENGEFVDLCYNPMGVSSRMNISQIKELNFGFALYVLGSKVRSDAFNGATEDEIRLVLRFAYRMANEDDIIAVCNSSEFDCLPAEFKKVCIENNAWTKTWKNCFNENGTARMFNPRTGKYFETDIVVGVNYVYKLIHEEKKKSAVRGGLWSNVEYLAKTDAPPQGSSKHGGQKMGSMEVDAFSAYGCTHLIQELLNARCDNAVARNNLNSKMSFPDDAFHVDPKTGIRRSTQQFRAILKSLGIKMVFEDQELVNDGTSEDFNRFVWKRKWFTIAPTKEFRTNLRDENESLVSPNASKNDLLDDWENLQS